MANPPSSPPTSWEPTCHKNELILKRNIEIQCNLWNIAWQNSMNHQPSVVSLPVQAMNTSSKSTFISASVSSPFFLFSPHSWIAQLVGSRWKKIGLRYITRTNTTPHPPYNVGLYNKLSNPPPPSGALYNMWMAPWVTSGESRRHVFAFTRFAGGSIWLPKKSLRHILAFHGYARGTIAVNVTWMKRGFNAC